MPTGIYQKFSVSTTDGAQALLGTLSVSSGHSDMITGTVTARRTGGSSGSDGDSAGFTFNIALKDISGTLQFLSQEIAYSSQDQAEWGLQFGISGLDLNLFVNGADNNNIDWLCYLNNFEAS